MWLLGFDDLDQVGLRAHDGLQGNRSVERCQLTLHVPGQAKQVDVSDLPVAADERYVEQPGV